MQARPFQSWLRLCGLASPDFPGLCGFWGLWIQRRIKATGCALRTAQPGFLGPDRVEEGQPCCSLATLESVADGSEFSSQSGEGSLFLEVTEEAGWAAAGPADPELSVQLWSEVTEVSLCS